ncbi:uncharacterized protein KIAA1143 homolog [Musca vetustissima]|uniref:uncharacterized protein KIAA1143 homolog n=1 Tax=Musca vetustissima TaxID=27455 RepID=UPI002AB669BA|nr:uncharacterized protein KIAA1143 homolog [Musca vetustissima]
MSKRNIAYIKPQDPSFLAKLKQEIGYKEGPNVDTKRQKLENLEDNISDSDEPEREDEKPLVVVLNSGDLTAQEAEAEQKRLAKEAAEARADLSKPIVFRKKHNSKEGSDIALETSSSSKSTKSSNKDEKRKKSDNKKSIKLSFNADEEEQEED